MNCKLYQRHNIESEGFPELFGEVSIKLSPRRNAYKSQQKLENPEEAISEDMNLIIQKQQNQIKELQLKMRKMQEQYSENITKVNVQNIEAVRQQVSKTINGFEQLLKSQIEKVKVESNSRELQIKIREMEEKQKKQLEQQKSERKKMKKSLEKQIQNLNKKIQILQQSEKKNEEITIKKLKKIEMESTKKIQNQANERKTKNKQLSQQLSKMNFIIQQELKKMIDEKNQLVQSTIKQKKQQQLARQKEIASALRKMKKTPQSLVEDFQKKFTVQGFHIELKQGGCYEQVFLKIPINKEKQFTFYTQITQTRQSSGIAIGITDKSDKKIKSSWNSSKKVICYTGKGDIYHRDDGKKLDKGKCTKLEAGMKVRVTVNIPKQSVTFVLIKQDKAVDEYSLKSNILKTSEQLFPYYEMFWQKQSIQWSIPQ